MLDNMRPNRIVRGVRNRLLKTQMIRRLPTLYLHLLIQRIGHTDPEMYLLPSLCDEAASAVDIGSHAGDYAFHMLRHSRHCHVFEPRPDAIKNIEGLLEGASLPITIHAAALSNAGGTMSLRVAPECPERSTLEATNPLEDFSEHHISVPVRRLDDCDLEEVGCIKIDVEGHELAVLEGAMETIRRDQPSLIIEAEERHNPDAVENLVCLLEPIGYDGYFLENRHLRSIEKFDVHEHQTSLLDGKYVRDKDAYVNNFIFVTALSSIDLTLLPTSR